MNNINRNNGAVGIYINDEESKENYKKLFNEVLRLQESEKLQFIKVMKDMGWTKENLRYIFNLKDDRLFNLA